MATTTSEWIAGTSAVVLSLLSLALVVAWQRVYRGGFGTTGGPLFNWHPVCMTLGLVVCFTWAILSYRIVNVSRPNQKRLHYILQTCATLLMVLGLVAVFAFHNELKIPNM